MIDTALLVIVIFLCALNRHTLLGLVQKVDELERVGVLMTSDKGAGRAAKPMSPRERIRWLERRLNGSQRATP